LFVILTVVSSVLIIVCHFDCCIVCPDHCLSFWLLYRLSWSLFVILTVVLSVLISVCHFDCCIGCPLINVLWLPLFGVCKPLWNDMCLLKPQFYLCTMYMLVYITFHFHIRNEALFWISNRIRGVLLSVITSCAVDLGFEPPSSQANVFKIGMCCFSAEHSALRSKSKDWLA
jgi:hypothetical protein